MPSFDYDQVMNFLNASPSIDKQKLNVWLKNEYSQGISSKEIKSLVNEYREIRDACYELATEIFRENLNSGLFHERIFIHYPKLNEETKAKFLNEAMLAQFR